MGPPDPSHGSCVVTPSFHRELLELSWPWPPPLAVPQSVQCPVDNATSFFFFSKSNFS